MIPLNNLQARPEDETDIFSTRHRIKFRDDGLCLFSVLRSSQNERYLSLFKGRTRNFSFHVIILLTETFVDLRGMQEA